MIPLLVAFTLGFGANGFGGEWVSGTVVKLDKGFVTIEDFEIGDMIRVHYDKRTKIKGDLKEGSSVEMEVEDEHAVSILVLGSDEEEGEIEDMEGDL